MKKIMVVEDNEQNLYLMQYLLEKSGYSVTLAKNGAEALTLVGREMPDLILMDIQLPDMDGLEVTRRLKGLGGKAPIVAVTSYAMVGDREKAFAAGCSGYVEKPIEPALFLEEIKRYLQGGKEG